jgi:ABC-type Fe3+ transport system permease subunit
MGDVTERWRASVFASLLGNMLVLAVLAVVFAAVLALVLAYAVQLHPSAPVRASARAASMGYALPGAVIAVGVLIPLAGLDRAFSEAATWTFGRSASLAKIPTSLDDAARSLGASIGGDPPAHPPTPDARRRADSSDPGVRRRHPPLRKGY